MDKETEKSKKKKWPWIVGALAILIIAGAINGGINKSTSTVPNESKQAESTQQKEESTLQEAADTSSKEGTSSKAETKKSYTVTLKPGYYEIGIDVPTGTYNFDIKSGNGNVTTTSGEVNLIMGEQSNDLYLKTYKNAELKSGDTLFVQQCSIKISSKSADTAVKGRDNSSAQAISLSAGKYTAGTDFQPGHYDIALVSGDGNVICSDNGLNAIFSKDSSVGVKEYKNVPFESGYKLDVEGAKVKLNPSK